MYKNFLDKARKTASRDKPKSVCVWKIIWKNLDILKLLGGSEMIWKNPDSSETIRKVGSDLEKSR